jgi:hypothetical protein
MNYTTVENVKGYLGIANTVDDALLERLVESVSAFVDTWLNRKFDTETFTDTFDGTGGQAWVCRNYPLLSVSEVKVNEQIVPSAPDTRESGYRFDRVRVVLSGNYTFLRGGLNCAVTYQAGYADVPADVQQACIEIIAHRYREKDRIGLNSKGLAGETISFSRDAMPESARFVLDKYKKVVPN